MYICFDIDLYTNGSAVCFYNAALFLPNIHHKVAYTILMIDLCTIKRTL